MTTLAELRKLVDKIETFGFKPEEVQVEFKSGASIVSLLDAKSCVTVTDDKAKPIVTVTLTHASPQRDFR